MKSPGTLRLAVFLLLVWLLGGAAKPPRSALAAQNEEMLVQMRWGQDLDDAQIAAMRQIFAGSSRLGQGNPAVTRHPMSRDQCRDRLAAYESGAAESLDTRDFATICQAKNMAPLYDPLTEAAAAARVCIDIYEFPNLPCAYPVVWVRASEAAALCRAGGKRLCDAHEWEGACAGRLLPGEYHFELAPGADRATRVARRRAAVNRVEDPRKVWSYGPAYREGVCGTGSTKSAGCNGGDWQACGSNTYPAGAFPACRSPLGVQDLHGNAAEHMNLPLTPQELSSHGTELGVTEMKGSWFIFDRFRAHEDACRWRAPYWHGSRVGDPSSHANYHLGFRCCKNVPATP